MDNIDKWRAAGKLTAETREFGKSLIKKGASLLEVSDKIEEFILSKGGKMAFPAQISCDEIAAHYCADPEDTIIFENQVASLDVGVHIDGCIGDTAVTVDLSGKYSELVKASADALKAAISVAAVGANIRDIGKEIHDAITSHGYAPVRNLSGHGLGLYDIHTKPSIPNFDTGDDVFLQKGQIIAIEPFVTDGQGAIYETERANIFQLIQKKPVRSQFTREILKEIETYNGLPFTTRWLTKKFHPGKVNFALRELKNINSIKEYPPLPDKRGGIVAQTEHTLLIDDKVEVLTNG